MDSWCPYCVLISKYCLFDMRWHHLELYLHYIWTGVDAKHYIRHCFQSLAGKYV